MSSAPAQVRPVAIVLGGTTPHVGLIQNLQKRGYHTVLMDYLESPPAGQVADEHIRESAFDRAKVLEVAKARRASLVVSVCLDQAVVVVASVSAELGLPRVLEPTVARLMTDKAAMKAVMDQAGIPTARWLSLNVPCEIRTDGFRYPIVAKPVDGTGSLGVVFIHAPVALEAGLAQAARNSLSGSVIVEEFNVGVELSIDCVVDGGKAHVLLVRERHKTWAEDGGAVQCHGTVAPAMLPIQAESKIAEVANEIAKAFHLRNCPLLIQMIVDVHGDLSVLEVAARLGGGVSGFMTVRLKTGVDLLDCAVCCVLDLPYNHDVVDSGRHYASGTIYAKKGVFGCVRGVDELRLGGVLDEFFIYRSTGDVFVDSFTAKNRVCAYVVSADTRDELRSKVVHLMRSIDIESVEGASMINRDIGLHTTL